MEHTDVMTIIGARPQFIKAAAVSPYLRSHGLLECVIHTGQHFDDNMSRIFFEELGLSDANINLDIHGGGHGEQTGRMLQRLDEIMADQKPESVLVYGDTNTTLAGALAAVKLHIPVIHVEAGLRSFNKRMPEEINRICTDHVSNLLLTSSAVATKNLEREGFTSSHIVFTGDVMYDTALKFRELAIEKSDILQEIGLNEEGYALATVHRAENTDNPANLEGIVQGLSLLASSMPVVLPLHPRTRAAMQSTDVWQQAKKMLTIIDPVGYLDMVKLEAGAAIILTDSGGVQKEAYFHQVPCVTLRNETEWTELVNHGFNTIAGCNPEAIALACSNYLEIKDIDWTVKLYGDGNAGKNVAESVKNMLNS